MHPLLTNTYWNSTEPDLRLNPRVPLETAGLHEHLPADHVIFATSGSSGAPKLVCLSREALRVSAESVNRHLDTTAADVWVCPLPDFHVGGFGIWARAFLADCAVHAFEGGWEPYRFTQFCAEHRATLTSLVPTQVFDLVQGDYEAPPGLRAVIVGGGALPEDLGNRASELGWPILASYGLTEAASQVATQHVGSAFATHPLPLLDHWRARVNEMGRLELRGMALFSGYLLRDPDGWRFDPCEDWFVTEDLAEISTLPGGDALTVLGRGARVCKILGELVYLDRLEGVLATLAGAQSPLVTLEAVADDRAGKRIVLVGARPLSKVVLEPLREEFNAQVAPFERIGGIAVVDSIPRTALGKIERAELAKRLDIA